MDTIVIVLLILIFSALLIFGVYYIMKDSSSKKRTDEEMPPQGMTLVNLRSAGPGGSRVLATYEMDMADFARNMPLPAYVDIRSEMLDEPTDLEILRDPDVGMEEKMEITRNLRSMGYIVNFPPESRNESIPAEKTDGISETDISSETDIWKLKGILHSPYATDDDKANVAARLSELEGKPEKEDEGEGSGEDDGGDDSDDGQDGDGGYGSGYVDPESHVSVDMDMEDPLAGMFIEQSEPAGVKDKPVKSASEASDDDSVDIDFSFLEQYDDTECLKVISLMTYIANGFRKGQLAPELVRFAEKKFGLNIEASFWTPEKEERAKLRVGVYDRNPELVNMSVDDFELYVQAGNVAAGAPAETNVHPESAEERKATASQARQEPKPRFRPVSSFFDAHGGKNDLMWQRLEPMAN